MNEENIQKIIEETAWEEITFISINIADAILKVSIKTFRKIVIII